MFVVVISNSLYILSYLQVVVNNFFYFFFVVVLSRQLWYLIMSVAFCQQLFESFYLIQSGEGGIGTLAPLLTTCTLSRGVPSASLGTSPYSCSNHFLSREVMILTQKKNSFEFFFKRLNRLAERMGFEPMCPCGQTVFKTASLWPLRYLSVFVSHESVQKRFYHQLLFLSTIILTFFHFFHFRCLKCPVLSTFRRSAYPPVWWFLYSCSSPRSA